MCVCVCVRACRGREGGKGVSVEGVMQAYTHTHTRTPYSNDPSSDCHLAYAQPAISPLVNLAVPAREDTAVDSPVACGGTDC